MKKIKLLVIIGARGVWAAPRAPAMMTHHARGEPEQGTRGRGARSGERTPKKATTALVAGLTIAIIIVFFAASQLGFLGSSAPSSQLANTGQQREGVYSHPTAANGTGGLNTVDVQARKGAGVQYYLDSINSCKSRLGEGDVLVLNYRFDPPNSTMILGYGGRDYIVNTNYATLTVVVRLLESSYEVVFRLAYDGKALCQTNGTLSASWEAVNLSIVKELRTLYMPGDGYVLPNGTRLGRIFPLFERGGELVVDYVWARLGEKYSLGSLREARAKMLSLTVWDLEKRLALELNGSDIIASLPLDSLYNQSMVKETIRDTESLRAMSSCPSLLIVAHYGSSSVARLDVDSDFPTGIPIFLVMEGAARYRSGGEYVRNGVKMAEMPASVLAEVLGIRSSPIALRLVSASMASP